MKNLLSLAMLFLAILPAFTQEQQISVPQLSPLEQVEAQIGITKIVLRYSRPSMRGRTIFGELVPYGELWRTGANVNTQISLADPITMADQTVPAGTYSLLSIPNKKSWTFIIYDELGRYGEPDRLEKDKIIAQFDVPAKAMDRSIESFDIGFDHHTPNSARLTLAWENTYVEIPVAIDTEAITKARLATSSLTLADDYASTAWIYYRDLKEVEKALAMIEQSISLRQGSKDFETWLAATDPNTYNLPWRHLAKSEMLAELGRYEEAIATAKQSLAIAQYAQSKSYIKSNQDNIQKWKEILKP